MYFNLPTSKTWTRTLKNLNPGKPGPWKTRTVKTRETGKSGPRKTWETAGCRIMIRRPHNIIY